MIPQCGQLGAASEISLLHSGQLIIMSIPLLPKSSRAVSVTLMIYAMLDEQKTPSDKGSRVRMRRRLKYFQFDHDTPTPPAPSAFARVVPSWRGRKSRSAFSY
jgi:hypothetical protein